jgi:phospho-N-acetylmuramoyl-pentapeptide-transferase
MLYHLFHWLYTSYHVPGARLFEYITFRAGMAIILSLVISILIGRKIIERLQLLQIGEIVRDLGLEGQMQKKGTPTMGGIIIILSILVPCLLFARLDNIYIQLMLLTTIWLGLLGFLDDYIKVFKKNKEGLSGRYKIIGQIGLGLIVGLVMLYHKDVVVRLTPKEAQAYGYQVIKEVKAVDVRGKMRDMVYVKAPLTNVPFMKGNEIDYGKIVQWFGGDPTKYLWLLFVPFIIFIVTAVSNAANLTDGMDGLATGVSGIIAATLAILAYVSSNVFFADYLDILYLPNSAELVIFAACFVGACIGFLWYNTFPAKVFMGDTGSLTIGGIIAVMAILIRKELLIPILCGIFVIENLSVVIQVSYFKYTKKKYGEGRRVFLMSPLHHHFQKKGIPEARLVTRFWIVGLILAVLTIITLKIR